VRSLLNHAFSGAEHGVRTDARYSEALRYACSQGHADVVRSLLQHASSGAEHGVRSDAVNSDALVRACERGHADVVGVLLKYDRKKSLELFEATKGAFKLFHHDIVGLLLAHAPNSEALFSQALSWARATKRPDVAKFLEEQAGTPEMATKARSKSRKRLRGDTAQAGRTVDEEDAV
jgi:ankyrin repeat protein